MFRFGGRGLGLGVLVLLSAAPRAVAAEGWSIVPSGGGRPAFYAEGTPGTVLQDTVSVTNPGRRPVTVRLTGTGLPVTLAEASVRVPARTRADVPFTVTVPANAAPGERTGTLVARDADGRTGTVRVRLRVGGPELTALTVEHLAVHGDRITYDLVNRGTTVLVPKLAVHADGVFGRVLVDRAPRTLPVRLAPGTRTTLSEPWPGRPALDAVDVRLTATAAGGAHATASTRARFVPRGLVAGTAGALAAAAVTVVRLRGRRVTPVAEPLPMKDELTGAAR
ncbi:cadherin repeat domain-containing protein [Streptomyces sp. NPDC007851]|uniref:COG1470 family protein n=1 Tax=Streptomyces sp. NPDC007851 TaxID=3155008 RepID=UPI0033E79867